MWWKPVFGGSVSMPVTLLLREVPTRQWVCSLPWRLRYALGYDRKLCADVLGAFTDALKRSLRGARRMSYPCAPSAMRSLGVLTFVQRADSALRLNVHFQTPALDGVRVRYEEGELQFSEPGELSTEDVAQVAAWTHVSLLCALKRHGRRADARPVPHKSAKDESSPTGDAACESGWDFVEERYRWNGTRYESAARVICDMCEDPGEQRGPQPAACDGDELRVRW
jgi:hypothetical protein